MNTPAPEEDEDFSLCEKIVYSTFIILAGTQLIDIIYFLLTRVSISIIPE
jgi:hypothetical protein